MIYINNIINKILSIIIFCFEFKVNLAKFVIFLAYKTVQNKKIWKRVNRNRVILRPYIFSQLSHVAVCFYITFTWNYYFLRFRIMANFDKKKYGPRFLDKKHNISTRIEHSWEPFLQHICWKETVGNHSSKCLAW